MKIKFIKSYSQESELLERLNLPSVALVGRSNVGKSSFINSLNNGQQVAHTSSKPGHTKLLNLYQFEKKFNLIDFPGYGFAKGSKTSRLSLEDLIFHGIQEDGLHIKFLFQIIDARIGAQPIDLEFNNFLARNKIDFEIILNKSEKLKNSEKAKLQKDCKMYFPQKTPILYSSLTGMGKNEVNKLLETKFAKK